MERLKNRGLWPFLAVVACLVGISAIVGCGAIPGQEQQQVSAAPDDSGPGLVDDTDEGSRLGEWVEIPLNPDGTPTQKQITIFMKDEETGEFVPTYINISSWFKPVDGVGSFNFYSPNIVVEEMSDFGSSIYPIDPSDPLSEKGVVAYGYFSRSFRASIVGKEGNESADILLGLTIGGGSDNSGNTFTDVNSNIPGCESGGQFSTESGEYCPGFWYEPNFDFNMSCTASRNEHQNWECGDCPPDYYTEGGCQANLNGGVIKYMYVRVNQTKKVGNGNQVFYPSDVQIDLSVEAYIMPRLYKQPVYPTTPCEKGDCDGDGKG